MLIVSRRAGWHDSVERYSFSFANFTPPTRTSLFYTARCKAQGSNRRRHESADFWVSAVAPNASYPREP